VVPHVAAGEVHQRSLKFSYFTRKRLFQQNPPRVAVSSSLIPGKPGSTSLLAESDNSHPENISPELTAPSLIPRCTHRAHDAFQQIQNLTPNSS
jgi:hypothetical protein